MEIRSIFADISSQFALDEFDHSELSKRFRPRKLRRRQYLLQEGDACNQLYFVVKGCFRMFAVDETGREHILSFFQESDWMADLGSFYSEQPGKLFIEAIEPSAILGLARKDVYFMYEHSLNFNLMIRVMVENKFTELQERVLQNISSTAGERYLDFLANYSALSQRIPNIYIASYLGITPEFLSKIRKNLLVKGKKP